MSNSTQSTSASLRTEFSAKVCGQTLLFDSSRAAFWVEKSLLILSDLHVGQRARGSQLKRLVQSELERVSAVLTKYAPHSVVVLGDFFHQAEALARQDIQQALSHWRKQFSDTTFSLVLGNRDRAGQTVYHSIGFDLCATELVEAPFAFRHTGLSKKALYTFTGHLHPLVRLENGTESHDVPCFHLSKTGIVLPAFAEDTQGTLLKPAPGDVLVLVGSDCVFPITAET